MMPNDRKTISIAAELFDKISTKLKNPQIGFSSVDEYIDHVLRGILDEDQNSLENEGEPEISEEETKRIKDELKKMGYI